MKYLKNPLLTLLALATVITLATYPATAQQAQASALERGYRTGYSDGYTAGFKDVNDRAARDYRSKAEYQSADRSYNQAWGTLEDYRDGYQQGFEAGYVAGFERRLFDSTIPAGIARREPAKDPDSNQDPVSTTSQDNTGVSARIPQGTVNVARDAILLVELQSRISTDVSQLGDRFQARVIQNPELEGAIVEGRITRLRRAGKIKGTAELQLSFDTIRMPDGRTSTMNADVVEVVDMGYGNEGTVDSEGGVKGRDSTKDDVTKVGASTGIGALIGAIVGGGKGAAIGAAIGGAAGTSAVLSSRGKDIRLERGQQLKIRTATETRVQ